MREDKPYAQAWYRITLAREAALAARMNQDVAALDRVLARMIACRAPDRDLWRQVLALRDPALVDTLLDVHGAAPFRALQESPAQRVALHDLFMQEALLPLLDLLIAHAIPVCESGDSWIQALATRATGGGLSRALADPAGRALLLPTHFPALALHASAARAAVLVATLRAAPDLAQECWTALVADLHENPTPKALALCLASGRDMHGALDRTRAPFTQHVMDLCAQTASAHGRLSLASREAPLEALMARPIHARFFDVSVSEMLT